MRVLVTGASGFVGSAVTRRLARAGHDVVVLSRHPAAAAWVPYCVGRVVAADIRDEAGLEQAVAGVRAVCHLAAVAHVREGPRSRSSYYQVNCEGTARLLSALSREASRCGTPVSLVFASTSAVYGAPSRVPFSEEDPLVPAGSYGASKLGAERLISEAAAGSALFGAVSLRAVNVAGAVDGHGDADQTRIIPRIIAVAAGRAPSVAVNGDGTNVREYLHVDDFAAAFELALSCCRPGHHRIYNVGSGIGLSVVGAISLARQITGRHIPVVFQPGQPEPRVLLSDTRRLRSELGWRPRLSTPHRIISDAWAAECSLRAPGFA